MNILGLDLGTKTGYAYNIGERFFCGTWILAAPKEIKEWGKIRLTRRQDPRVIRLAQKINLLCGEISAIVIEDVMFSSSTYQTQLWASLRSAAWLSCALHKIQCGAEIFREAVPVGTLKLYATGHGNAVKTMMNAALRKKHPEIWLPSLDDNATDAAWVWLWAKHNLGRMKL
jgi:hypothetical protein